MSWELLESWLEKHGFLSVSARAEAMLVTSVTLRKWERTGRLPSYLLLYCLGVTMLKQREDVEATRLLSGPRLSVQEVRAAMSTLGLESQNELAMTIHMTKQAVSKWFRTGHFPRWLAAALYGAIVTASGGNACVQTTPKSIFLPQNVSNVATITSSSL